MKVVSLEEYKKIKRNKIFEEVEKQLRDNSYDVELDKIWKKYEKL